MTRQFNEHNNTTHESSNHVVNEIAGLHLEGRAEDQFMVDQDVVDDDDAEGDDDADMLQESQGDDGARRL